MKEGFAVAGGVVLLLLAALVHTPIKEFLWTHPWWHSTLVAVPTIALALLAYFELGHSREANALRGEANILRGRVAELEAERNRHLQQIAENTRKPVTAADRNAATLRQHLRSKVKVSEEHGSWPDAAEIVEVSSDNIVTLFTPHGFLTSTAFCVKVHCDDLQITDIPEGICPLRIKVLRRYGQAVELGQITKWEDHNQPPTALVFPKGSTAYHATYAKPGSPETRRLTVYASRDGANSFLLEAIPGGSFTGDNVAISKQFMLLQIEYEAAGFSHRQSASGGSSYPLFVKSGG